MSRPTTWDHPVISLIAWNPEQAAERINDHILMARGTSHSYVITSADGDIVINSGTPYQGARMREQFEQLLGRKLDVKKIIFTQSHPDHIGGWAAFADAKVETIVQRMFPRISNERKLLASYFQPRAASVLSTMTPKKEHADAWYKGTRDPEPLTLFADRHEFVLGGRIYELRSAPSGETLDALLVWMPGERTLFIGNWAGAIYGALPNFYTARGDRDRSISRFLEDIESVIALRPALLITGHGEPIAGEEKIHHDLCKLRDAVRHIHDETVKGMNAHKDLYTLMQEIILPEHLKMQPGRGPVAWYVRAVWEEYTGWFQCESTTELYAVPPRAIWPELAVLAGGADTLAQHAQQHVKAGRHVEALHFLDIALTASPNNRSALQARIAALEGLADANGGETFDELGWLENQIVVTQKTLAALN